MMKRTPPYLGPDILEAPPAPGTGDFEARRAMLVLRTVIGMLGIATPFIVVLVDRVAPHGRGRFLGSLSAYYYAGTRDVFVGCLITTGVFLLAYKASRRNRERLLSDLAGVTVIGVALFPTGRFDSAIPPTPVQQWLGEGWVKTLHGSFAAVFILSLAFICYDFGTREREAARTPGMPATTWPHQRWARLHFICTGVIVAAIGYMLVSKLLHLGDHYVLVGEVLCTLAFGTSWTAKGLDLTVLTAPLPKPRPARPTSP